MIFLHFGLFWLTLFLLENWMINGNPKRPRPLVLFSPYYILEVFGKPKSDQRDWLKKQPLISARRQCLSMKCWQFPGCFIRFLYCVFPHFDIVPQTKKECWQYTTLCILEIDKNNFSLTNAKGQIAYSHNKSG